jgi:anti-sigma factor RsiW
MTCVSPPELGESELLAYLDGEADRRVTEHLEGCPYCRERAERLARLQYHLTGRLYRSSCPPPIEIGEYHLGLLPPDRASAVAQHLLDCPHCRRERAQLADFMESLAPDLEFSPAERVKVLVARLVGGPAEAGAPQPPVLVPVPVGLRGEEGGPFLYQAGDVQIAIEIQEDADRPEHRALLGLVTGIDAGGSQVSLWQADKLVRTVEVDEAGNFYVAGLAGGSYELFLTSPELEVEVHVQELPV